MEIRWHCIVPHVLIWLCFFSKCNLWDFFVIVSLVPECVEGVEMEAESIDGKIIFSCVILQSAGQETWKCWNLVNINVFWNEQVRRLIITVKNSFIFAKALFNYEPSDVKKVNERKKVDYSTTTQHTTLGEEKPRDPERSRQSLFQPSLGEVASQHQIFDPRTQGF